MALKGKNLLSFTAPELLKPYAEIMELYYTGDKIGYRALAKQLKLNENVIMHATKKYKPRIGTNIVILLQSKINDMWGQEDAIQESPAD